MPTCQVPSSGNPVAQTGDVRRYLDGWAFPSPPRQEQVEALEFAAGSDSGILLIEAPTGTGKSGICMTLAAVDGGTIMTPQKVLQDQYSDDWPDVPVIKGRNNYECATARKHTEGKIRDCDKGRGICSAVKGTCPYYIAAERFFTGSRGITNYSYFFATAGQEGRTMPPGKWLLFDEGHNMEEQLISSAEVVINWELCNDTGASFRVPDSDDDMQRFGEEVLSAIIAKLDDIDRRLRAADGSASVMSGTAMASGMATVSMKELSSRGHLEMTASKLRFMLEDMGGKSEWVFSTTDESVRGKPLFAFGLYQKFIAPLPRRVLVTSATMVPPDLMAQWFGWKRGNYESLLIDSSFPIKNRFVYYAPVASLNRRNLDDELPAVVDTIVRIAQSKTHGASKGIIHCHSFALGEKIFRLLPKELWERCLLHRNTDDREMILRQHVMSPRPSILISPSMTDGVDLHDDLARFVIIPKVPYPSLGDPWVRRRMEVDPEWYDFQVAKAIVQGCGRAVRHKNDWADTYILDGNFGSLYERSPHYFPAWFKPSVRYR